MSKKKFFSSFSGKGYYIALILCAAAIGITGYVYNQNEPAQEAVQETLEQSVLVDSLEAQEDIPVLAVPPAAESATAPAALVTEPAEEKGLTTASPVSGGTIMGYSMETLSYNETTRDWRVHNGIDLAAEEGSPVTAAAEGQVTAVFEDEIMGHTVELRHTGGYTTRYASLGEAPCVSVGDTVSLGQTIGYAGDTALVETAMGSHVHFSVTCQNQPMDPAEFLSLGH